MCGNIPEEQKSEIIKGDIDGDEEITSFDAYKALELSVSEEKATYEELKILDIDGDGDISSFDAYQILSYSVGIIDENYWRTPEPDSKPEEDPIPEPEVDPAPEPKPIHIANPIEGRYYYNQLDKYGKIIYDGILRNKENLATEEYQIQFESHDLTELNNLLAQSEGLSELNKRLQQACSAFYYDNPEVFFYWFDYTLQMKYLYDGTEYFNPFLEVYAIKTDLFADGMPEVNIEQTYTKLQKVKAEIQENVKGSEYEKILQVHDYLIKNIEYDTTYTAQGTHTIYGALLNGRCVCEGYARSFKYLLNAVGIECETVIGTGQGESHAWNAVKLEGKWYYVDVTWDDPVLTYGEKPEGYVEYNYFLKGTTSFEKDHIVSPIEQGLIYPEISSEDYAIQ